MIIKEKYNPEAQVETLEEILKLSHLSSSTRKQVQQELRKVQSGLKGEKEAAYYINYHFQDSKNWMILHDLRLEHKTRVAQIDHLLINRGLDFYVLETKHFCQGLRITEDGEFLVSYKRNEIAIPSPIEQNQRHVILLKEVLKDRQILPKRLGMTLKPRFKPYVLISPNSRVIRPKKEAFDTSEIIKADTLFSQIDRNIDEESTLLALGTLTKLVGKETLEEIGDKLAEYHQPLELDYDTRFDISRDVPSNDDENDLTVVKENVERQENEPEYYCYTCRKPISQKVALYCFKDKKRFGGRAYCFNCQKKFKNR